MFRASICNLQTRRTFHISTCAREEWTKASLRRMKKVELISLAKENNLNASGTKNDVIIQLLTHQTVKIVGSATPAMHNIEKVIQGKDEETSVQVPEEENDEFEVDSGWMNAFDMKIAQRGSRKSVDLKRNHFTSKTTSKPHPFNEQIKANTLLNPAQDKPKPTFSASTVPSILTKPSAPKVESNTITATEEIDGMDPQWVEAFDLKVGSRAARHQSRDTLSPTIPSTNDVVGVLEFIKVDTKKAVEDRVKQIEDTMKKEVGKKFDHVRKHIEKHGTKHYHNDNNPDKEEKKATHATEGAAENSSNEETYTSTAREKYINATVGSSMFIWYYSEGLSKIWHFLSSTCS